MNVLTAAVLLAAAPAVAAAQGADAAIDKAVAAYEKAKTARATFEQTITNPLTGTTVTSRGEFERKHPDRFVFRFTEPKGDIVVSDGTSLWVYLPSSQPGQVIKMPATGGVAGGLDVASQFFSEPRKRFTIGDGGAATIAGSATRAVKLVPKEAQTAPFQRATVWVDAQDGTLRQFEVVEQSGLTRLVKITNMQTNVAVSDAAFRFSTPKGVRVIDQRALTGSR